MAWSPLPSASQTGAQTRGRPTAGRDCFTEPQRLSSLFYCDMLSLSQPYFVRGAVDGTFEGCVSSTA